MDHKDFLMAMSLSMEKAVPSWYAIAPLHNPPGLKLTLHQDTWRSILSSCGKNINGNCFRLPITKGDWTEVSFRFPSGGKCKSLQKTIAYIFDAMDVVIEKHTRSNQLQLIACGILDSRDDQLKGYLMDIYVSYELKRLLNESHVHAGSIVMAMNEAMKKAATHLRFPIKSKHFFAFISEGGFLNLGVGDGSGITLAVDYRDREDPERQVGYTMTSDNIDSPALQLIFLYAIATAMEYGTKQLVNENFRA